MVNHRRRMYYSSFLDFLKFRHAAGLIVRLLAWHLIGNNLYLVGRIRAMRSVIPACTFTRKFPVCWGTISKTCTNLVVNFCMACRSKAVVQDCEIRIRRH